MPIGSTRWNTQKTYSLCFMTLFLAACATTATPKINLKTGGMTMEVTSKTSVVMSVAYSPDGKSVLAGGYDDTARLWDLAGAKETMKFKGHTGAIMHVAFSPDAKTVATIANDGTMRFWDIATGKEVRKIDGAQRQLFSSKPFISPDGKYFLGDESGTVKMYDVKTGNVIREFKDTYDGIFSPESRYILLQDTIPIRESFFPSKFNYFSSLIDMDTGKEIWKVKARGKVAFSPDGRTIVVAEHGRENLGAPFHTVFKLLNTATGREIREFGRSSIGGGFFPSFEEFFHEIGSLAFSPDGKYVLSGDLGGRYKLWDVSTGTTAGLLQTADEISGSIYNVVPSAAFSPNGKTVATTSFVSVRHNDVLTGEELATMIGFEDGEWLVITPNGYYNSSEKGDQYLSVTVGGQPYTIAQLRESFYRPDLVQVALAGGSLKELRKLEDVKQPPSVVIVETPSSVSSEEVTIKLRISDQGGGIGDVRLYLNGSAVVLENTRNLQVTAKLEAGKLMSYKLRLVPGKNSVRAIAFNGDNSMQSTDALHEVEARIAEKKPSLHALVVGIKDFQNPRLNLRYTVADAQLFSATLREGAGGLFESVNVKTLTAPGETTKEAITVALNTMKAQVRPQDLFVFYVASHGTVDEGEYFLITANVGATSTDRLKSDALSQNSLKEMLANVPATKKLLVLDTCNAGKIADTLQVAMLTRGMSEETAFKVLSRAVGSTILSAATSLQEALEGYRGHGLFTYVLVEGLKGKADLDKDGFIKTKELASYVEDEVPLLAEKVFKHKQYPIVNDTGQGFPVVRVR